MPSKRVLSLVLALTTTGLLLAWNVFQDTVIGSAVLTVLCFAVAIALGSLAVRLAWLAPASEAANPRS
ncbi:MAG: hypothetical protein Q7K25_09550 [Actinomycetota bacterium]|nr:hypothetical protein [Actinomycetota bacterium]